MGPFPIKSAEIQQTLPQMTFLSQRQFVVLLVVLRHLLARTTSENKLRRYFKKQRNDATVP